jgi:hypothetical protein
VPQRLTEQAATFAALLSVVTLVCRVTIGVLTSGPRRRSP